MALLIGGASACGDAQSTGGGPPPTQVQVAAVTWGARVISFNTEPPVIELGPPLLTTIV